MIDGGRFPSLRRRRDGSLFVGSEAAEQTIGLVVRTGGEVEHIPVAAIAEHDRPQPVDDDRLAVGIAHLVRKFPVAGSNALM